jgi:putative Mg2+ transporter-C (MgtC) family protein
MTVSIEETFIRLLVITLLSGLIGIEREYHGKPAGLRTNVMVGLGSAIMTLASIRALDLFPHITSLDPTRISAQIVTGIGFIGAGAILRPGKGHVVGLTTAATLWVVAGLGIAVAMGLYKEAVLTTILVFFTFFFLTRVVSIVRDYAQAYPPKDKYHDAEELMFDRED